VESALSNEKAGVSSLVPQILQAGAGRCKSGPPSVD